MLANSAGLCEEWRLLAFVIKRSSKIIQTTMLWCIGITIVNKKSYTNVTNSVTISGGRSKPIIHG